jgi:hypothetical protein
MRLDKDRFLANMNMVELDGKRSWFGQLGPSLPRARSSS